MTSNVNIYMYEGACFLRFAMIMISILDNDVMRFFSMRAVVDGEVVVPELSEWSSFPRKMSFCQHVVGTDQVVCFKNGRNAADVDVIGQGFGIFMGGMGSPENPGALVETDVGVQKSLPGLMAVQNRELFKHESSRKAVGLLLDRLVNAGDDTVVYVGAPILVESRVVGSFCVWFHSGDHPGTTDVPKAKENAVKRAGLMVGKVIEEWGRPSAE